MQEFIGLAYFAEIPVTIIDVQRGGPSTGMPTRTQQSDVLKCAYASHGDTKHVLLFPEDPHECFEFAALALDLADRLQTPVFLMTDLDIGMNQRLASPLEWDDARRYDRGKVMTAEMLDSGREFGRYLDVDGDGIPFAPIRHAPFEGRLLHPRHEQERVRGLLGAGADYKANMQRLLRSSRPPRRWSRSRSSCLEGAGALRRDLLRLDQPRHGGGARRALAPGLYVNAVRVRSFRFQDETSTSFASHSKVFVIEQNRDAQLKTLLVNDAGINPASLISVLHYDGTRSPRATSPPRSPRSSRRSTCARSSRRTRTKRMIHRLDAGIYSLSPLGERARVRG